MLRGVPKANVLWVPTALWLAYAGWEWLVVTQSPEANIRVDLMLIWPVLALEDWDISRAMARMVIVPPQLQPLLPDHPNWSWHEYGMRVGFWRMKTMLERVGASRLVESATVLVIGHSPRVTLPERAGKLMRLRERCHGDSCFSVYEAEEPEPAEVVPGAGDA